jgi:hypothetical protein
VRASPFHFDEPERLAESLRGTEALINTYWVRFDHALFSHGEAVAIQLSMMMRNVRPARAETLTWCWRPGTLHSIPVSVTREQAGF